MEALLFGISEVNCIAAHPMMAIYAMFVIIVSIIGETFKGRLGEIEILLRNNHLFFFNRFS